MSQESKRPTLTPSGLMAAGALIGLVSLGIYTNSRIDRLELDIKGVVTRLGSFNMPPPGGEISGVGVDDTGGGVVIPSLRGLSSSRRIVEQVGGVYGTLSIEYLSADHLVQSSDLMEIKNSSQSPKPMPWSEDADYAIHFDPSTKPIPEDIHWVRVRATFWVELETSPNNVIVNYHDTLTLTGTLRLPSANLTLPTEITTWSATSLELDMTGFVQPGTSYYLGTSLPERSPRIVLTKVDKDGHELGTPKAYDVQLEQSWADPTMPFIGNVKGTVLVSQTALGKPDFLRVALFAWAQQGSTPDTAAWFRVGDRTTRVLTVLP